MKKKKRDLHLSRYHFRIRWFLPSSVANLIIETQSRIHSWALTDLELASTSNVNFFFRLSLALSFIWFDEVFQSSHKRCKFHSKLRLINKHFTYFYTRSQKTVCECIFSVFCFVNLFLFFVRKPICCRLVNHSLTCSLFFSHSFWIYFPLALSGQNEIRIKCVKSKALFILSFNIISWKKKVIIHWMLYFFPWIELVLRIVGGPIIVQTLTKPSHSSLFSLNEKLPQRNLKSFILHATNSNSNQTRYFDLHFILSFSMSLPLISFDSDWDIKIIGLFEEFPFDIKSDDRPKKKLM